MYKKGSNLTSWLYLTFRQLFQIGFLCSSCLDKILSKELLLFFSFFFVSLLHRTWHSSIRLMLYSCICWCVKLWTAKKQRSLNCKRLYWHVSICHIRTWEMRLVIRWSHFWWKIQRISSGIGKDSVRCSCEDMCFDKSVCFFFQVSSNC